MDKQYRLRDVFSIPTVLFAFIGLTAMTVSFVGGLTGVTNESASILGAIGLSDSPPSKDSQYGADWYGKDGIGRITVHKSDVPYYIAVHLNRD